MTTLNFDEDVDELQDKTESSYSCPATGTSEPTVLHGTTSDVPSSSATGSAKQLTVIAAMPSTEKLLNALMKQTQENSVLLRQALAELKELKQQVQTQRKIPFTVKTCGFERELVLKAKEVFVTYGPWLVQGALERLKEQIALLLGGTDKVDAHHVSSCVSYCKEKYTLWRADIRKKVLNRKLNHLKINEFTAKLYAPFKSKDEDMKNATKTAMLLRKFANEKGYFENTSKSDFWDMFVEFANSWNKIGIPNKWAVLRTEDESKFMESLEAVKMQMQQSS
ncbi:uncharacterized protein [Montipora capricornis]|uniref:uncharacterized protein isoform X1 n=2 Tax=Montipora foliosa TaxID=591990 RepID=UPI0035F118B2